MPFSKNKAALELLHKTLSKVEKPTKEQALVRKGLACLLENPGSYACVHTDNPFVKEFFAALGEADASHDSCFSIFECMAVIFREKALRDPDSMTQEEKDVLVYFESAGQWTLDGDNLASRWYWERLPLQVVKESGNIALGVGRSHH